MWGTCSGADVGIAGVFSVSTLPSTEPRCRMCPSVSPTGILRHKSSLQVTGQTSGVARTDAWEGAGSSNSGGAGGMHLGASIAGV